MQIIAESKGRIDKIIADYFPQYSRAALTKLFGLGLIKLDGMLVKPGHKVRLGANIEVDISPLEQDQQVIELPIIFEDDNVIVIDKPAGIISHARGRFWYEPSVASFVRWKLTGGDTMSGKIVPSSLHIPDGLITKSFPLKPNIDGVERMGIVHRLDRATSGVMVCSKNEETLKQLQKQFAERKVIKTYIAVLEKAPKENTAVIDAPIERNPIKPSQFRVGANGKPAQTLYRVLKIGSNGRALVEFKPKTGRTHQLRVHAKYINCPIVGDAFYGSESDRLYLHAKSIELEINGKKSVFNSEYPKEFDNAVK